MDAKKEAKRIWIPERVAKIIAPEMRREFGVEKSSNPDPFQFESKNTKPQIPTAINTKPITIPRSRVKCL